MPPSNDPDPASGADLQPFEGLDPQAVLDALDAVGMRADGRLLQLNSYENRVFQVYLDDGRIVVAKFYRPGRWSDAQILEEHGFAAELAAAEIPLAAPLPLELDAGSPYAAHASALGSTLATHTNRRGTWRFGIGTRLPGRAPELEQDGTLEWLGRFIGRLHAIGARSRFRHRMALTPLGFGRDERDWLLGADVIPPDAEAAWRQVSDAALAAVDAAFAARTAPRDLRLHGDCHLGNILWTAAGPHFVDLDDALNGPAVQDLWMLLSGDRASRSRQLAAVLDGYEAFMDFDRRELRLIEPLRTLRILRHSAWIARRWHDPAFPVAFPWFASSKYWSEQTTQLEQQLDAMAEAPLGG